MAALGAIDGCLARLDPDAAPAFVDGSAIEALDTAGAMALAAWLDRPRGHAPGSRARVRGFRPHDARVFALVRERRADAAPLRERRRGGVARIGENALRTGALLAGHVRFLGRVAGALPGIATGTERLRPKETTVQLGQVFVDAIPVVCLVTLLIGVVIAYLLGLQASQYGASTFVVDGVAIGATREFSPIIVAVIVAGRSGSGFTAQLGAMRLTEEIDAIRTLGLSPTAVLVLPRLVALVVALPLLVFIGDAMSLVGAALVAHPMLDITPAMFVGRLRTALDPSHFLIGLAKAPVFAIVIGVIGCRMGMTAARDTRSVGLATTSTVVQSIVAVILLDAGFAVLFQALDW